ncbi:hypothetical protein, partial [Thioclava sp. JE_KL1]|uniref:hypothetical protein n=1 Tax=Thioclava sp. JE_KL1 TaxID=2651187 RepID=UPI001562E753
FAPDRPIDSHGEAGIERNCPVETVNQPDGRALSIFCGQGPRGHKPSALRPSESRHIACRLGIDQVPIDQKMGKAGGGSSGSIVIHIYAIRLRF